jgi:aryl-alcohol dehydrogenase-like predicted oxidoreductase
VRVVPPAPVTAERSGRFPLGGRPVARLGFGGMKLTGPRLTGPPADRDAALAVLRRAVELGVEHLETSDHYGPHVVNQLVREALHPYPEQLVLLAKVGARRTPDGGWVEALAPDEIRRAVEDDLEQLGVDALDVALLRLPGMGEAQEGSLARPFEALAALQQEGLVRSLGVSHVTAAQVAEARRIAPLACVQHEHNLVNRGAEAMIDGLSRDGIAFVAVEGLSYTRSFPARELSPAQRAALEAVARRHGATPEQTAMAWLLACSPNVLLIPGATSVAQLEENVAAAGLALEPADLAELDRIADAGGDAPGTGRASAPVPRGGGGR